MADKAIVTNLTALKNKYGADGVTAIKSAVRDLIAADKERGLKTILTAVDDAAAMKKLDAPPVINALDPRENKKAIDGIYRALTPDYLMILGAIDVIPHQDLKNAMFSPKPDADNEEFAYSDLPYACGAAYSQDVNKFTGPTRVVGRLPDLTGHKGSPSYLIGLLKTATNWKSSPREAYQDYLGISAQIWKKSTAQSLTNTFNTDKDMQTTPKKRSHWNSGLINRRAHFINCHGGDTLPDFYGQSAKDEKVMPVSHRASYVAKAGNILEGTVVAAECCFGAQLYDPSAADDSQMGMCNAYLSRKAYGFLGSSTTAYGPAEGNDQADLICQYFMQRVLAGASLGRATLEARQRFIEKKSPLNHTNQKTLAQFNLFGDPSIVPVNVPTSALNIGPKSTSLVSGSLGKGMNLVSAKVIQDAANVERAERREKLTAKGTMLGELQPEIVKRDEPSKKVKSSLDEMMSQLNLTPVDTLSFDVEPASSSSKLMKWIDKGLPKTMAAREKKTMAAKRPQTTAFHVAFGVAASSAPSGKSLTSKGGKKKAAAKSGVAPGRVKNFVVLEAKEVDGKIVSVSQTHSK
jgi:hypothetical protein